MCGISGFWTTDRGADSSTYASTMRAMTDAMTHRGPDSSGLWMDEDAGLVLGHRRLSILELSELGHQPMVSHSGRYVLCFNGEVYNFGELRRELDGRVPFKGNSDTEVMLAAIEVYGLEAAVSKFVGMFAFALWDREQRRLHLVRDRVGIKPLYYGMAGGTFVFASELHAFRAHPGFEQEVDRDALALLLRHNCIPAPFSIYKGVRKLLPGTILTLTGPRLEDRQPVPFWSAKDVAANGMENPFDGGDKEATDRLEELVLEAVKMRMVADVPLGAFLSGGVDSSLVVAAMQAQSDRPIQTFTIGSDDPGYDEAGYADAVASHLGTDHTELRVSSEDALAIIPRLATMYDEPFADSSQIPTFLVSELARRHVTVSLSGDGGDELFGGYNRHVWGARVWNVLRLIPQGLRGGVGRLLEKTPPSRWDRLYSHVQRALPQALHQQMFGYKVNKLGGIMTASGPLDLYRRVASHWDYPEDVVVDSAPRQTLTLSAREKRWRFRDQMMYLDLVSYLPDDILTKVDRASMNVSLEARVPLLDHRIIEFAWRLPDEMKLRDGQSKWLLRQVLYRHVPRELIERPKSGFGIPLDTWLRGPLRDWAENLLDEQRLKNEGFFNPSEIRERWADHLSGKSSWQYHLWDVLIFQAWLEHQNRKDATPLQDAMASHVVGG